MELFMLFRIFFLLALANIVATELTSYSENTVFTFIGEASVLKTISDECSRSLLKVKPFLSAFDTIPAQKYSLISSFSSGPRDDIRGRDQFRWSFRMRKCFAASGSKDYAISEYPTDFCFAEESDKVNSSAYAICIPTPCENDKIELLHVWQRIVSNSSSDFDSSSAWCGRSRKRLQWYQQSSVLAEFAVTFSFIFFIGLVSAYDFSRGIKTGKKSVLREMVLAFSMKKNGKRLISMPKDEESTITCMFGIRFVTLTWIVFGHCCGLLPAYLEDLTGYRRDSKRFLLQFGANPTLSVDTFFLLGGILISFIFFSKVVHKVRNLYSVTFWFNFILMRALRLWPAYIFTLVTFSLRWSRSGMYSLWPASDIHEQCAKSWWKNLLFINSIYESGCLIWTWYIGATFMFVLVTPAYLLALKKSAVLGILLSLATILISAAFNIAAMVIYGYPPVLITFDTPPAPYVDRLAEQNANVYIKPEYRIGPHIVGLLVGYMLAKTAKDRKYWRFSRPFVAGAWIFGLILGFYSLYGSYPILQGWKWPIYGFFYGGFHRTLWAVSLSWVIFACHMGIGGFVNRFLSMSIFVPLSNLCYSVYLIHALGLVIVLDALPFPLVYPGVTGTFWISILALLLSYKIGLYTLFIAEFPADNLIKLYTNKNRNEKAVEETYLPPSR